MTSDHSVIRDGSDEACGCEAYCSGPKEYRCDFEYHPFSTVHLHIQRYFQCIVVQLILLVLLFVLPSCKNNYCLRWNGEAGPRCDGKRQVR